MSPAECLDLQQSGRQVPTRNSTARPPPRPLPTPRFHQKEALSSLTPLGSGLVMLPTCAAAADRYSDVEEWRRIIGMAGSMPCVGRTEWIRYESNRWN